MADIAIFRINYKSDFILTLQSDAGWITPFCIKFWTGAPSKAYYAYYDGMSYTHCTPVEGDPTKLLVQFDDHHLPIGDLKFQIGYHFTVADFPTSVEDEVINQAAVIIEVDDAPAQVMLDFNGETAPEIQFALPAYANEAQRIANEQARIAAEEQRIANEQARISAEETRQANEQQRINAEAERVSDFASLKTESEAATAAANIAATLANEKAQLADDKAALAQAAATLANAKAQLAADKAALAQSAATLANEKAALAQQKAEYAQEQGDAAKTEAETAHALNEEVRDDEEARDQAEQIRQQQETARQQAESQRVTDFNAQMQQQQTAYTNAEAARDTAFDEAETERDAKVDAKVADITNLQAQIGYFVCDTDANTAAKTIAATGYVLGTGGNIRIKMTNANTVGNATLNINSTGAKPLFYEGVRASSTNTWKAGETVEVYYDGTNFYANNVAGGGGGDGVFDVSEKYPTSGVEGGNTYTLDGALAVLNANLPASKKKGGMSIKFVQSSDNKYVQYRLIATTFSTNVCDWIKFEDNGIIINWEGQGKGINVSNGKLSDVPNRNRTPLLQISTDRYVIFLHEALFTRKYFLVFYDSNGFVSSDGWRIDEYMTHSYIDVAEIAPNNATQYRIMIDTLVMSIDNIRLLNGSAYLDERIFDAEYSILKRLNYIDTSYKQAFKIFSSDWESYNEKMTRMNKAINALYIKTPIEHLKILVFRKRNNDAGIYIGTATSVSDVHFDYTVVVPIADAIGVKSYTNSDKSFYIEIDWDKVDFEYKNLWDSIYEISNQVYSIDNSPLLRFEKIEKVLPQETVPSEEFVIPAFIGAYSIHGVPDSTTNRFRSDALDVEDLQSISCAEGYTFTIWGNDEGLNHDITLIPGWKTGTYNLSDFQYRYLFIVGKRVDENDIQTSELNSIITGVGLVKTGNFLECVSKNEYDAKIQEIENRIKDSNIIIVDKDGSGDYTSLQDAITNAGDSAEHPKTILVLPGIYEMPAYDTTTRSLGNNRYLSIIGTDKNNCILKNTVGYYTTSPYVDNAPLKLGGNVYVANLTIISTDEDYPESGAADRHKAYCIHLDFSAPENTVCEINNCVLINNHFSCIGFGLRKNNTIKIINCEMKATMDSGNGLASYGTLYGHDGQGGSTSVIEEHLLVKGCIIENTNGNYGIRFLNAYDVLADMTLVDNVVVTPQGAGFSKPATVSLTKKCFGNNLQSMNY